MNRLVSAVSGGIPGTAVLLGLLMLLEVETRSAIPVFAVIARFVGTPGNHAVGFVVFALAGCLAWPLLFVALEPYIPRGPDPATRGAVLGTVLWIAFVITGRGSIGWPLVVIYAAYTLIAHWAYGFMLGAVYGRLLGSPDSEVSTVAG
jgi:hypothetical protein